MDQISNRIWGQTREGGNDYRNTTNGSFQGFARTAIKITLASFGYTCTRKYLICQNYNHGFLNINKFFNIYPCDYSIL